MESLFILFLILFVIYIAIIFSKKINEEIKVYPTTKELELDKETSFIVKEIHEYEGDVYSYEDRLSRLISKLFNEKVSSKYLIIGDDFEPFKDKIRNIYSLRDIIGISGYVAYVEDENDHEFISQNVKFTNKNLIDKIVDCDLVESVKKKITNKLNQRWKQLIDTSKYKLDILNSTKFSIENKNGKKTVRILEEKLMPSYAIIKDNLIENTILKQSEDGYKINMLCSDREFNTLMKRISEIN